MTYEATGSQTTFNIPFDYLRNSFVKAKIGDDGEPMEYGKDYTVSNRQITFGTAPTGQLIVYRETPTDRMVQFMEGSVLKANDMNISTLQQLHIIEENEDWTISNSIVIDDEDNAWEARNLRIKNVADPTNAQDVVTKHYMESVQDGFVQQNTALKNEATAQANKATQQATIATQKATTATQQADRAQAWAESATSPDGEPDSKSSKTWAEEAAASASSAASSASTATTQAGIATTKASEAASSASTATTQAGIATTKASEAASSASSALSSKNAAATSASNAATSESNAAKSAGAAATSASNAATSESNAASSAQQAAETAAGIGNPVASITENGGTLTITKTDGAVNTILQILKAIQDGNGNNIVNTYATKTDMNTKAPLASPTFTGSPKATTPSSTDNSTRIATTAFVKALVGAANNGGIVSANLAQNGYVKFANGFILQWGYANSNGITTEVNFPIPFSKTNYTVIVCQGMDVTNEWGANYYVLNGSKALNSFSAYTTSPYSNGGNRVYWIALKS